MKMIRPCLLSFIWLIALVAGPVFSAERILIGKQVTDPQGPEASATAADLMEQVASLANRLFGSTFAIVTDVKDGKAGYTLSVVLSLKPGKPEPRAEPRSRGGGEHRRQLFLSRHPHAEVPTILARAVFLLWSNLQGTLTARTQEAPVFADEIQAELLAANSTPMSLAMNPEGTLVAALAVSCVELDHSFRLVDRLGAGLYDAGLFAYAYGVSATPGGTI